MYVRYGAGHRTAGKQEQYKYGQVIMVRGGHGASSPCDCDLVVVEMANSDSGARGSSRLCVPLRTYPAEKGPGVHQAVFKGKVKAVTLEIIEAWLKHTKTLFGRLYHKRLHLWSQ